MADTVNVGPTAVHPNFHLSLTDGSTTVGLILCDGKGNPTNLALRETPVPPQVTRIASTDSGYSDFEQPYTVTVQDDWSGGRGQETFEEDKSRYMDGYRADTWGKGITCGPKSTFFTSLPAGNRIFFEYLGTLFFVVNPADGTAPKIFMNGLRGCATSNAGDKSKTNTTRSLSGKTLAGKIIKIIGGAGFEEEQSWRQIVSNTTTGTNDTITVSPPWIVAQDTTTRYIVYTDDFTEITGHGLTKRVTDVSVVDTFFYVLQGDGDKIIRGKLKDDETWETWGDEGSNKGTFFEMIADKSGKRQIIKAHLGDVEIADAVEWPTALTFGTSIPCGNRKTKITRLIPYGNPQKPYIIKEDCFGSVADGVWAQIPLGELASVRSEENGQGACQNDVYLYFSLREGVERYYDGKLDDIGPDRDMGLPGGAEGRQGTIYRLVSYPGGIYAVVRAPEGAANSLLFYNKVGWHEFYRGGIVGRFSDAYVQVIPNGQDRLWVSHDSNLVWLPLAKNPLRSANYRFFSGAQVESSWIYTSLAEINKYWSAIKVFSENLSAGHRTITVEYRTDNETDWHTAGTVDTSPSQKLDLGSHNVVGRRIQYRLTLNTDSDEQTPRVTRVLVEGVQRVPPKRVWTINFYLADEWCDLNGTELTGRAKEVMDQLRTWADSQVTAAPVKLLANFTMWNDIYVFAEPPSIQPIEPTEIEHGRSIRLVGQMTLREA